MYSTSVGVLSIPASMVAILAIISLSLTMTSYVIFSRFNWDGLASVVCLIGGILMLVVIVTMTTDGPLWSAIGAGNFFGPLALILPTWYLFYKSHP